MHRVATCLLAIFVCLDAGHSQPLTGKLANTFPPQAPPTRGAEILSQKASAAGLLRLDILPPGALGLPPQVVDLVRSGTVDMAVVPTQTLIRFNRNFEIFSLPFAFPDLGYVFRFQESESGKTMLKSLDEAGLKGLSYWSVGMTQLFSRQPVRKADDLKGLKVARVNTPLARTVMQSLGANTPNLGFGEVVAALERGVVDASDATPAVADAFGFARVQKFMNVTNQEYAGGVLIANAAFWSRMSAGQQNQMLAIIGEVTRQVDQLAIEQTEKDVERLRSAGVDIVRPEAGAFKTWQDAASRAWLSSQGDRQILLAAMQGGAEGGGDTCGPGVCRCQNRTCSKDCCRR